MLSPLGELCFHDSILSVKLRRDLFAVVMPEKIYVYTFAGLKLRHIIATHPNTKGLCGLSTSTERGLLVCPDIAPGRVLVQVCLEDECSCIDTYDSEIGYLELNPDGNLLAVASEKGTIIRLYRMDTKEIVYQLRRGMDKAEIYNIAFHPTSEWIACSSDKGTIHIYSISASVNNPRSGLALMKIVMPAYYESQSSYAQFKIKGCKTICCFAKDSSTVVLVTDDGNYHTISYAEPGECREISHYNLFEV